MIEKLLLENWKTHKRSEFSFGKGTNVLVGVMGSGKTAVTDAICFSLFGTFPALQSKRVSIDEIIMSKPEQAESARLQMEFDYRQKKYSVERLVHRGKKTNEAKLYCGGRLIAGPKVSDVNKKIEEALEVDYDLFSRAVYSEQNQIDFFLRLSPGDRKEKFDELLEINKYETARANAVQVANRLKRIAEDKKNFLREQKQTFSGTDLKGIEKRLSEKQALEKDLGKKICEAENLEKELLGQLEKLEKKEKEFRFFKELVTKSSGKIEALENDARQRKKELDDWKGKSIEAELKELDKKEKELLEQNRQNEKLLKELRAEQAKLFQGSGAIENRLKQIRKSLSDLENAEANCPVCRKPMEAHTKKQIKKEHEDETEKLLNEKEKNSKENKALEARMEKISDSCGKALSEIDKLHEQAIFLKNLQKSSDQIEKQEKEIASLKAETEKAEREMKTLGFDERELSSLREKKANATAAASGLNSEIAGNREGQKELAEQIDKFKKIESQLKEIEANVRGIESLNEKLALFTNCLVSTQGELREKLIEAVNLAMSDIWQRIYPYRDYSSAKILVGEKGDYELVVLERSGKWVRVEGILSGGERSAAAICIRIAFSLVLTQNLSWLILDEPTHNLDAQAVSVLSEMMKSHLPGIVEQVFVITHDKQMEKAASASLYLLERDKNNDGATVPVLKETE